MNKLKFYLFNAVFSGLIGATVECAGAAYTKQAHICLFDLLKSTGNGVFIGTVAMLFFFHVFIKLKKHPLLAFFSVFIVVALLSVIGDIWAGPAHFIHFIRSKWLIVLTVSECLGLSLAFIWYRQLILYNQKLDWKKRSNRQPKKFTE